MRSHFLRACAIATLSLVASCVQRSYHEDGAVQSQSEAEKRNALERAIEHVMLSRAMEASFPEEMVRDTEPRSLQRTVPLETASFSAFPSAPPNAHRDFSEVPPGMTVVGQLSPERDTVVLVHGWAPIGQASRFFYADKWHQANYNTVLLRWHQGSFDPAPAPYHAEQTVWKSAGDFAVGEYKRLLEALGPDYKRRVWMVSHSLGTQMAMYVAASLISEGKEKLLPKRFEVIDPYVTLGRPFPQSSPLHEWLGKPDTIGKAITKITEEIRNRTTMLMVCHAATIGRLSASNYWRFAHVQVYDARWLGGNIGAQHAQALFGFLRSIELPPPRAEASQHKVEHALSATTPDGDLRGRTPLKFLQVDGLSETDFVKMRFDVKYNLDQL